jgi:hypothetical protein
MLLGHLVMLTGYWELLVTVLTDVIYPHLQGKLVAAIHREEYAWSPEYSVNSECCGGLLCDLGFQVWNDQVRL